MCTDPGERPSQTTQWGKGEAIAGKEGVQITYMEGEQDKPRQMPLQCRKKKKKTKKPGGNLGVVGVFPLGRASGSICTAMWSHLFNGA